MKYKCLEKFSPKKEVKGKKIIHFINKCLSAVVIGLVVLITMEYSPKFKTFMNEEVLGKNISFGFIGKIYNKYFGNVLPVAEDDSVVKVFNEKIEYSKKEKYLDGVSLTVKDNYLVPVIESGVVVFIGDNKDYGKIVTIEQEDGATVTYGNIQNVDLKLYDFVAKGKFLGEVNGNTLYIIILKDNNYLDIETYLS